MESKTRKLKLRKRKANGKPDGALKKLKVLNENRRSSMKKNNDNSGVNIKNNSRFRRAKQKSKDRLSRDVNGSLDKDGHACAAVNNNIIDVHRQAVPPCGLTAKNLVKTDINKSVKSTVNNVADSSLNAVGKAKNKSRNSLNGNLASSNCKYESGSSDGRGVKMPPNSSTEKKKQTVNKKTNAVNSSINAATDACNQTISNRNLINANWHILLANIDQFNQTSEEQVEEQDVSTAPKSRSKGKSRVNNAANGGSKLPNKATDSVNSRSVSEESAKRNRSTSRGRVDADSKASSDANSVSGLNESVNKTNKEDKRNNLTKFIAIDCEMVGIGFEGKDHMLARVSLVNKFGDCVYDKFVKAREDVVDYRTSVSGVRKEDLLNGEEFTVVQKQVAEIIRGKILVGHSLQHDLGVLFLSHPKRNIRDTSKYKPLRKITKGSTPSLRLLVKEILGAEIQTGEHSSVEDAKAVMQIYCTLSKRWESELSGKRQR